MKSKIALLILALLVIAPSASASDKRCIKKACFEKSVSIGDTSVPLVGLTKFKYLFFSVYTIALYAPDGAIQGGTLLSDVPKQMIFHYHRDISREDMIGGADKNLAENPKIDKAKIQGKLDEINAWYTSVKEDDRYTLTFEPNVGLSLAKNGKKLGTVEGNEFANKYMGMWISDFPLSETLRNNLLGLD